MGVRIGIGDKESKKVWWGRKGWDGQAVWPTTTE